MLLSLSVVAKRQMAFHLQDGGSALLGSDLLGCAEGAVARLFADEDATRIVIINSHYCALVMADNHRLQKLAVQPLNDFANWREAFADPRANWPIHQKPAVRRRRQAAAIYSRCRPNHAPIIVMPGHKFNAWVVHVIGRCYKGCRGVIRRL